MLLKHDYPALIREYDQRRARGESHQAILAAFEARGINAGTFQNQRTKWKRVHPSTPEGHQNTPGVHLSTPDKPELWVVHPRTPEATDSTSTGQDTPAHPGTLEAHQEVMEDIHHSVPEASPISTAYQGIPDHPSTPEVHPDVSPDDSTPAHSGVPARQEPSSSTPMVHPGTPTDEDWQLWAVMKTRWKDIEHMLADWQTRHRRLSTPSGTPRHTVKRTYVVDSLYVELIDRYASEQGVELQDIVNLAFQEFFERREYLPPAADL